MASWLGSGAGLIMIGLAWLVMKFHGYLPQKAHAWAMRVAIAFMFMGGSVILVTNLGEWTVDLVQDLIGMGGGIGEAIAVIVTCFLLATVVVGLVKFPVAKVAAAAAILPLALGLFDNGALHDVKEDTTKPAQQKSEEMKAWLGETGS